MMIETSYMKHGKVSLALSLRITRRNCCFVRKPMKSMIYLLLLICGDVEECPGPVNPQRVSCTSCMKTIHKNQKKELCYNCKGIFHLKCLKDVYKNQAEKFHCITCSTADPIEN